MSDKDTIYRQDAIDVIMADKIEGNTLSIIIALGDGKQAETLNEACDRHAQLLNDLPSAQPDEKLEKCRFEYINACRIVTYSTPDTTKKDISDAYAVIKVLQPIFGDVAF